jgi:catechol 2,3-dioxygenase
MPEGIHSGTTLGSVQLAVLDLGRAVRFYTRALGLSVLGEQGSRVSLGSGEAAVVALAERPGAAPRNGTAGLYHLALLLPPLRPGSRAGAR